MFPFKKQRLNETTRSEGELKEHLEIAHAADNSVSNQSSCAGKGDHTADQSDDDCDNDMQDALQGHLETLRAADNSVSNQSSWAGKDDHAADQSDDDYDNDMQDALRRHLETLRTADNSVSNQSSWAGKGDHAADQSNDDCDNDMQGALQEHLETLRAADNSVSNQSSRAGKGVDIGSPIQDGASRHYRLAPDDECSGDTSQLPHLHGEISEYSTSDKQDGSEDEDDLYRLQELLLSSVNVCSTPKSDILSTSLPAFSDDSSVESEEDNESGDDAESNSDVDSNSFEEISIPDKEPSVSSEEESIRVEVDISFTENDNNDDHMKFFQQARALNQVKLFEGSNKSVNDAILEIMDLYLKNSESKSGLDRLVKSVCRLLPKDNSLPSTGHRILSLILGLAPRVNESVYYYCKDCCSYVEEAAGQCPVCATKTELGLFYHFDVGSIIKYLFKCRNLAVLMDQQPEQTNDDVVRDIQDGTVYKELNAERGQYDVNLVLNTDGARVRKGSKKELWLLMCTIVEVPIHLRSSFICVLGVWYDELKPSMSTFFKPFCDRMKAIHEEGGITFIHPVSGVVQTGQIKAPLTVADAPARAKVQNVINFNGRYGCNICEVKTKRTLPVPEKRRIRVYPYCHNVQLRDRSRMMSQATEALEREDGLPVKGVKGPSILSLIPSVDISLCLIPDFMHAVLLGVMNMLFLWTEKRGDWNISQHIHAIDSALKQIQHPDFVHRITRTLSSLKVWKASDLYYFLMFEALPVLHGFLPDPYFQHFILFVKGIFLLLKRSITSREIEEADLLLKLFVNRFENLYSDRDMTYNLHQLCHLGLSVKRFGSLSCNNAFPFEGMNGTIVKATHGTNHIGQEIVNNIKVAQGIVMLKSIVKLGDINTSSPSDLKVLGKPVPVQLTEEEVAILGEGDHTVYSRAKIGYDVFSSEVHKKLKSSNFYVKWFTNESAHYGSIKFFATMGNELCVCVREFDIDHQKVFYHEESLRCVDHFIPVLATNRFVIVKGQPLFSFVKIGKVENYLYERPNNYHHIL